MSGAATSFVTVSVDELGKAAEDAITQARAGVANLKSGELSGLAVLDAYDEAKAVLTDAAGEADQTDPF